MDFRILSYARMAGSVTTGCHANSARGILSNKHRAIEMRELTAAECEKVAGAGLSGAGSYGGGYGAHGLGGAGGYNAGTGRAYGAGGATGGPAGRNSPAGLTQRATAAYYGYMGAMYGCGATGFHKR
ncbi:hypothetical protein JCM19000A_38570 [Silvimonas sp. JCM 19000]